MSILCPYGFTYTVNLSTPSNYSCVLSSIACKKGFVLNKVIKSCIPVAGFYVPFPNIAFLIVMTSLLIIIVKARPYPETKLITSVIALWSFAEPIIYWEQMIFAFLYNEWAISALCFAALIVHYSLNSVAKLYIERKE